MGNRHATTAHSEPEEGGPEGRQSRSRLRSEGPGQQQEEGEEPEVELPPPMRPISSIPATEDVKKDTKELNGLPEILAATNDSATEEPANKERDTEVARRALEQREFRIRELVESERDYVADLAQCVQYIKFMRESKETESPEIPMPDDLKEGKDRMIFGNLEMIYEWHRDYFSKNLEKCLEKPEDLGNLFKKCERKFQMYVVYCQNKPKSEFIVSEHIHTYFEEIRLKYGFKLRLTDLLIKPIQRLTKYHMLLEAILKHSLRAGLEAEAKSVEMAFQVMTVVPNQANDMMDIGRLQGFEGKIVAQGKLLLRGPLLCTEDVNSGPNYKLREMTVFLFEQIMIFAETVGKKTQFTSPIYTYKAHIQVNKMQLEEKVDHDPDCRMFKVKSTDPSRPQLVYLCQAEDQADRDRWTGCMRRQLQTQLDFLKALQAPIAYHNKMSKELNGSDLSRQWEVSSSTTVAPKLTGSSRLARHEARPRSNPQALEQSFLSIEEAFDKAMSLPSSPVAKEPKGNFDNLEEMEGLEASAGCHTRFRFGGLRATEPRSGSGGLQARLSEDQLKRETEISFTHKQVEVGQCGLLPSGTTATVLIDYRAARGEEISLKKGDKVRILSTNLSRGYLVQPVATSPRDAQPSGWLPAYTLHPPSQAGRRGLASWGFRVRKSSFTRGRGSGLEEGEPTISVLVGESGHLSCRVESSQGDRITWHTQDGKVLVAGGRFAFGQTEGRARLTIHSCQETDSGEYLCTVSAGDGGEVRQVRSVRLAVTQLPATPPQPKVQDLKGTSAVITWETGDQATATSSSLYRLEQCRISSGRWHTAKEGLSEGLCILENLVQGETYSFRLVSYISTSGEQNGTLCSLPSLPSPPLTVPLTDLSQAVSVLARSRTTAPEFPDPVWLKDFELQYIELEEVGRGRFSVVRRCQEIITGKEVAVKFINRRKRSCEQTRREYDLLARIRHNNIVGVSGLFSTPSSDAIVMDLVCGHPLFVWLCDSPSYSESTVCGYMVQLLSALSYLHSATILHLDIRPENILLEADNRTLKLIDLGESESLSRGGGGGDGCVTPTAGSLLLPEVDVDSAGLEFLAPEQVSGGQRGPYTDMWSFGVILYVLLSGMSPFLDDCTEETRNNILRCDFSFPETDCTCSSQGRSLVSRLLVMTSGQRLTASACLASTWLRLSPPNMISSRHLNNFNNRRRKRFSSPPAQKLSGGPRPQP